MTMPPTSSSTTCGTGIRGKSPISRATAATRLASRSTVRRPPGLPSGPRRRRRPGPPDLHG
jgi:hypothetical protein